MQIQSRVQNQNIRRRGKTMSHGIAMSVPITLGTIHLREKGLIVFSNSEGNKELTSVLVRGPPDPSRDITGKFGTGCQVYLLCPAQNDNLTPLFQKETRDFPHGLNIVFFLVNCHFEIGKPATLNQEKLQLTIKLVAAFYGQYFSSFQCLNRIQLQKLNSHLFHPHSWAARPPMPMSHS